MSVEHAALLESVERAIAGGSGNLSSLLGVEVAFTRPTVLEIPPVFTADTIVTVTVEFTEGISGTTALVFTTDEARQMVEVMLTGMDHTEEDVFGELGLSALGEAMNQFVAGIGRRFGEEKGYFVNISTPSVEVTTATDAALEPADGDVIVALDGSIGPTPGRLYWTMSQPVVDALLAAPDTVATTTDAAPTAPGRQTPDSAESSAPSLVPTPEPAPAPAPASQPIPDPLSELGRLADVMLDVTVELGRSHIPIRELLALDEGGVIRLGRPVGEPVDLLVNGLTTARGEIVVVDGRLGLRVTELIA